MEAIRLLRLKVMTPYEKFLIKQRVYCDYSDANHVCMNKGTHVVTIRNHHDVRCNEHSVKSFRDYEPEQKWGTHHDYREHQKYGGTRDDY